MGTNQIIATLPATLLQNPDTLYISVSTPQPGGGTFPRRINPRHLSRCSRFRRPPAACHRSLLLTRPRGARWDLQRLTLHLTGSNFVTQSEVFVNGANRSSIYDSSTSLTVQLSSTDVVNPGTLQITVVNPAPGGGNSTPFPLNVDTAVPTISAVAPTTEQAGGTTAVTLTVTGTGFLNQYSSINFNGVPLATTVSGGTSAATSLTPDYLLQGGVNQVTVVNAGPGGGISNILTFAVNPTHLLGLPILADLAADGSQAANGLCGGLASCTSGALGLTTSTVGPSTSNTGQYVGFASASRNLVLTDLNTAADVFVRNTCLGVASCSPVTAVVSSDPNGNAGERRELRADHQLGWNSHGVYVAGDQSCQHCPVPQGTTQVYWRPVCYPTATTPCTINPSSSFDTQLVSVSPDGTRAGNGPSYDPVISPDGQYVAFVSLATNLVTNIAANGITPQVYIRNTCDIATIQTSPTSGSCVPTTYLVSTPDGMTFGDKPSSHPSISEDGLFVSFTSLSDNLGSTAPNPSGNSEIFERSTCVTTIASVDNTCTPVTTLVSTPDGTNPADGVSDQSSVSSCGSETVTTGTTACTGGFVFNGRFIAFASTATTLIPASARRSRSTFATPASESPRRPSTARLRQA